MSDDAPAAPDMSVSRDPNFVRLYADSATPFLVGRDIEMAFMVNTPDITRVDVSRMEVGIQLVAAPMVAEICRVRMSDEGAFGMTLNVIFALLQDNRIEGQSVLANIQAMLASLEKSRISTDAD